MLFMDEPLTDYVRVWKRDGSENYMPLRMAILNVAENTGDNTSHVRRLLETGNIVETDNAIFMRRDVWDDLPEPCPWSSLKRGPARHESLSSPGNAAFRRDTRIV